MIPQATRKWSVCVKFLPLFQAQTLPSAKHCAQFRPTCNNYDRPPSRPSTIATELPNCSIKKSTQLHTESYWLYYDFCDVAIFLTTPPAATFVTNRHKILNLPNRSVASLKDGPLFSFTELTTEYCLLLGYDVVRLRRIIVVWFAVCMIRVNFVYQTTWFHRLCGHRVEKVLKIKNT